jgi:hypothetical protein
MDTPSKDFIRRALRDLGPSRMDDIKARTGMSSIMLYASVLQMEDEGEVLSNRAVEDRRGHRIYRLPDQAA